MTGAVHGLNSSIKSPIQVPQISKMDPRSRSHSLQVYMCVYGREGAGTRASPAFYFQVTLPGSCPAGGKVGQRNSVCCFLPVC